ncbi:DUF86 domain-containing protein [candidate division KSB1 bacterium]|nr:DUF86 domain-containing protein [candidate division KSB1 bacterium]
MLNRERLTKYLEQISSEIDIINSILVHNDEEILESKHFLRSLKYSAVVIAEAIANTLQHILAKKFKVTVSGYKEVLIKSRDNQVVSSELLGNLHPFIRFRNMLIHQYWDVDDQLFLTNLRSGTKDFQAFINEIERIIESLNLEDFY